MNTTRRGFVGGLLAFFGIGVAARGEPRVGTVPWSDVDECLQTTVQWNHVSELPEIDELYRDTDLNPAGTVYRSRPVRLKTSSTYTATARLYNWPGSSLPQPMWVDEKWNSYIHVSGDEEWGEIEPTPSQCAGKSTLQSVIQWHLPTEKPDTPHLIPPSFGSASSDMLLVITEGGPLIYHACFYRLGDESERWGCQGTLDVALWAYMPKIPKVST